MRNVCTTYLIEVASKGLVPLGFLRAVWTRRRFVDRVADADAAVWIHSGEAVILGQFGLNNGDWEKENNPSSIHQIKRSIHNTLLTRGQKTHYYR